jgi:hypothetical protein
MSSPFRFAEAAGEIADEIVAKARSDDDSVHWLTAVLSPGRRFSWQASAGLYTGTAGIALFLLDAGDTLNRRHYRDLALAALSWCFREAEASRDYSFYVGRMGVAYVMLRAFALTGDTVLLERALRLGEGYETYASVAAANDLLAGVAGSIIGFLHLHQQTREAWIVDAVRKLAQRLVSTARWTPAGLSWDVRPEFIRGLCGLSHGTAGVAFALLEAAEYLAEPAYRSVALEALRYESYWYLAGRGTWPDFRKLEGDRESGYRDEQLTMPEEWLTEPAVMDAWCHGAPGIALSRLRAIELLGPQWKNDAMRAVARTRSVTHQDSQPTFTLCHGACGNAVVFLEAARVLGGGAWTSLAEDVGDRAIETRRQDGCFASGYSIPERPEDISLMMGNAGIGEFLLSLAGGGTNVLLPRLTTHIAGTGGQVRAGDLMRSVAKRMMPKSMAAIEASIPEACAAFFDGWRERSDVLEFIVSEATTAGHEAEARLETEKLRMLEGCSSFALVAAVRTLDQRRAEMFREEEIDSYQLQLARFSVVWRGEEGEEPRLLRILNTDVQEIALTEFSAAVLDAFELPATMTDVVSLLEEMLESKASEAVERLRTSVRDQILSLLRAGILVVAGSRPSHNRYR